MKLCPKCSNPISPQNCGLTFYCPVCQIVWSRGAKIEAKGESLVSPPALPLIFLDAAALISGPRRENYGPVKESFKRVAMVWSALLKHEVTPSDVAKLMIAFKLCREAHAHKRDNIVDMAGYLALLDTLTTVEL